MSDHKNPSRRCPIVNERGYSLIETAISIAIIASIAAAFLGGLTTASKTLFLADEHETAQNLAAQQMEYVKQLPWADSYSVGVPGDYAGYSVVINASDIASRDNTIQKIAVVVSHNGKAITTLEDYRMNR